MTDRIDHAAEALALLNLAAAAQHQGDPRHLIAAAQVNATLALVEQQRIATLIALADSTTSTVAHRQTEEALYGRVVTHVALAPPLRPNIAAALGIEAVDHD